MAELWGVYYGLFIARKKAISRLEVEVDSKMVVEFLTLGIGETHPLSFLDTAVPWLFNNGLVSPNRSRV